MSVKVREKVKGSKVWWLIISHKGQRASKRIETGAPGKKAAELAATKIAARLADGGPITLEPSAPIPDAATFAAIAEEWATAAACSVVAGLQRLTVRPLVIPRRLYSGGGQYPYPRWSYTAAGVRPSQPPRSDTGSRSSYDTPSPVRCLAAMPPALRARPGRLAVSIGATPCVRPMDAPSIRRGRPTRPPDCTPATPGTREHARF